MINKWTIEETEKLKTLYNSNVSMKDISKALNRTYIAVRSKAVELKLSTYGFVKRKYNANHEYFKKIDSIEKAYIFGLWCADGCISDGRFDIAQHSKDEYLLMEIKKLLEYTGPLKKNGPHNMRLTISSKEICQDIKNLGGMERKSVVMPFPSVPEVYYLDFIRGYCDGDGSVWYKKPKDKKNHYLYCKIIGGHILLSHIQKYILENYNLLLNLRTIDQNNNFSILDANGKKAQQFLDLMYKSVNDKKTNLFLTRKYEQYLKDLDNRRKQEKDCWGKATALVQQVINGENND